MKNINNILNLKNKKIKLIRFLSKNEIQIIDKEWNLPSKFYFFHYLRTILKKIYKYIFNKNLANNSSRSLESVLSKYNKISGNYVKWYENKNAKYIGYWKNGKLAEISGLPIFPSMEVIKNLIVKDNLNSFIEIGAGELTTTHSLLSQLNLKKLKYFGGIDLSFKRLNIGKKFLKKKGFRINFIARANAAEIPFSDNSFDVVYSNYCLEQMPHIFDKIVDEMVRISKKYVVLIEPSYEFGSRASKNKIISKGYPIIKTKNFRNNASYQLLLRKPTPFRRYINGSEIIVLKKKLKKHLKSEVYYKCPVSKKRLFKRKKIFLTKNGNYFYPIKNNIPLISRLDLKKNNKIN